MKNYKVEVRLETKGAKDPEGETIYKYIIKPKYGDTIKSIKPGKIYYFNIKSKNEEQARTIAENLLNDLRIYNPVAHNLEIEVLETSSVNFIKKFLRKIIGKN